MNDSYGNVSHQKLVDGLAALVLQGHMTKSRAIHIIAAYREYDEVVDESVLWEVRKDLGLAPGIVWHSLDNYIAESALEATWRDEDGCPDAV